MPHLQIPAHQLRIGDLVHVTPNQHLPAHRGLPHPRRPTRKSSSSGPTATQPTTCPAGDLLHIHRDADE